VGQHHIPVVEWVSERVFSPLQQIKSFARQAFGPTACGKCGGGSANTNPHSGVVILAAQHTAHLAAKEEASSWHTSSDTDSLWIHNTWTYLMHGLAWCMDSFDHRFMDLTQIDLVLIVLSILSTLTKDSQLTCWVDSILPTPRLVCR
jgi:hypothetical protein